MSRNRKIFVHLSVVFWKSSVPFQAILRLYTAFLLSFPQLGCRSLQMKQISKALEVIIRNGLFQYQLSSNKNDTATHPRNLIKIKTILRKESL